MNAHQWRDRWGLTEANQQMLLAILQVVERVKSGLLPVFSNGYIDDIADLRRNVGTPP
jgi:hypothetical protein